MFAQVFAFRVLVLLKLKVVGVHGAAPVDWAHKGVGQLLSC